LNDDTPGLGLLENEDEFFIQKSRVDGYQRKTRQRRAELDE
jgi:hypothetical protein